MKLRLQDLFTPISIGEILKVRAWACSGLINNMALKKHDEKILGWRRAGDTAELVPTSDRFDPKSFWAIIDGLESICWAYTWAGCGDDATTQEFVSPFIQLVRQRPTQLPAVKSLYDAAAWELCLLLR